MKFDFLIVGAGFYGSVLAERISNILKKKVLIIDKRSHIGGNCFSDVCKNTDIEYHKYGTHIFHTSNKLTIKELILNLLKHRAYVVLGKNSNAQACLIFVFVSFGTGGRLKKKSKQNKIYVAD